MAEKVRWTLQFNIPGSATRGRDEPGFPQYEYWHPDRETAKAEACRVLRELADRGDTRDWRGHGGPDPFAVGSGRVPGNSYSLKLGDCP